MFTLDKLSKIAHAHEDPNITGLLQKIKSYTQIRPNPPFPAKDRTGVKGGETTVIAEAIPRDNLREDIAITPSYPEIIDNMPVIYNHCIQIPRVG
jgi:hypothetical protein